MTSKDKQLNQKLEILGWVIALEVIIDGFLQSMFPQFMSLGAVIWFNLIFFVVLCFWDRNLLKKQDNWKKNKIAWGWCLFSPVYLYKRARVLKENLLKFWICMISFVLSMIYVMHISNEFASTIQSTVYHNCVYELSARGVQKDKATNVCWSKQAIFNQCVDNLMGKGTHPNMIMDICNEHISKINLCAKIIVKESGSEVDFGTALELCICSVQHDKQYCLEKYASNID